MQAVLRLVRVRDAREAEERGGRGAHSREAGVGGRARRGISDERGSRGGPRRARDGCETGEHAARACASPSLRGFEWCSPPMMTWPPDLAVRNSEHTNTTSVFFSARGSHTPNRSSQQSGTRLSIWSRDLFPFPELSSDCLLVPLRFFGGSRDRLGHSTPLSRPTCAPRATSSRVDSLFEPRREIRGGDPPRIPPTARSPPGCSRATLGFDIQLSGVRHPRLVRPDRPSARVTS